MCAETFPRGGNKVRRTSCWMHNKADTKPELCIS